ncbi:hypothetical protein MGL_1750 [Malassezia globosa CBS 7966]|uniref:MARVEL domain-containing protein n=1 Tax=Malassezia globosa (strain ATCC MYA-4612 / CBS 7966) TaxID=425265 RepID=A8Q186_MALGO|nr:uncharacterized protein MGL_1750 [Malassezia globosa CBS 7966]EDP43537.1 hypothetical protein MGL_1750 [Malassezia globosa CBS 7966]
MELSSAIRLGHPIAFSLFIFFSLVVAIIASAVTADFNSNGGYDKTVTRDSTRFMVFTGWWSFLFGVIFLVLFLTGTGGVASSIAVHGVVLLITWIFWLCGSAALSNVVGNESCGNDDAVRNCNSLKAILAFGWIGWIELTALLAVICYLAFKAFRGGRGVQQGFA